MAAFLFAQTKYSGVTFILMDKTLLARATSSDDAPTPGYLYTEISKMTLVSYEACKEIQNYLMTRLKRNHHNVKFKSLCVIKHVCRTGRAEFRKDLQRQTESIRECLTFRGPPDPLRGESIYKRVHEVAKEALEAIYETQQSVSGAEATVSHRIQGFGSEPWAAPAALTKGGNGSSNDSLGVITSVASSVVSAMASVRPHGLAPSSNGYGSPSHTMPAPSRGDVGRYGGMQGVGNPAFTDPRHEKSFLRKTGEGLRKRIGSVVHGGSPQGSMLQKVTFAAPVDRWSAAPSYSSNGLPTPAPLQANEIDTAPQLNGWAPPSGGLPARPDGPGGIWGSMGASNGLEHGSSQHASQQSTLANTASNDVTVYQQPALLGRAGGGISDGSFERHLVDDLCAPGGTRALPGKDQLEEFLRAVKTLNVETVGGHILDVLGAENWQVRSKALSLIEALIKAVNHGDTGVPEDYKLYFIDNAGELEALLDDSKAIVRDKAVKILYTLGIVTSQRSSGMTSQASPTARQHQAPLPTPAQVCLLDLQDEEEQHPDPNPVQPQLLSQQKAHDAQTIEPVSAAASSHPGDLRSPDQPDLLTHPPLPLSPPTSLFTGLSLNHPSSSQPSIPISPTASTRSFSSPVKAAPSNLITSPAKAAPTTEDVLQLTEPDSLTLSRSSSRGSSQGSGTTNPVSSFDPLGPRRSSRSASSSNSPACGPGEELLTFMGQGPSLPHMAYGGAAVRGPYGQPIYPEQPLSGSGAERGQTYLPHTYYPPRPPLHNPAQPQPSELGRGPLSAPVGIMAPGMLPALSRRTIVPTLEEVRRDEQRAMIGAEAGSLVSPSAIRGPGTGEEPFAFVREAMRRS